jgi:hypothetical protein
MSMVCCLSSSLKLGKKHITRNYLFFSILFGLLNKRIPHGVFFKPFSGSLKMTRLLSDLVALHAHQTQNLKAHLSNGSLPLFQYR